tara:strand:- start:21190 stop:21741 length:552 start_codon:yes stop_codon:yes gene_type:complete
MKVMQKYFLAIVPEGEFQEKVTTLKLEIRDRFQAKFALKSPAHVTLKMPFIYNEAKEDQLIGQLRKFGSSYGPASLSIKGVKTFGERVIYLGVDAPKEFYDFQSALKSFCKRKLNLVDELSDRNYQPHMTIAFKDVKKTEFQNILKYAKEVDIYQELKENQISVLKRVKGEWKVYKKIDLGLI